MMRNYRICITAGLILIGGCRWMGDPIGLDSLTEQPMSVSPEPSYMVEPDSASISQRFTENQMQQQDAVQSAVQWSDKYDKLSETAEKLRQDNMRLFEENNRLKEQVKLLQADLDQTRKELDEANQFLQQMHLELGQWKTDVLGFREEIRRAQAAQLTALSKILRILGAEPVASPAADQNGQ